MYTPKINDQQLTYPRAPVVPPQSVFGPEHGTRAPSPTFKTEVRTLEPWG